MNDKIVISGFADEIDPKLDEQLKVVTGLGMNHISLRAADGKGIADYTVEEAKESLLPRLQAAGVKVSSLGSPIGKVGIEDEEGFEKQLAQLDTLCQICQVLDCRYIRMFSFFIPEGKNPDDYHDQVLEKLKKFAAVAEKYNVVLIHENEKEIYGDIGRRFAVKHRRAVLGQIENFEVVTGDTGIDKRSGEVGNIDTSRDVQRLIVGARQAEGINLYAIPRHRDNRR